MRNIPGLLGMGLLLLSLFAGITSADGTEDVTAPFSLNSPGIPLVPGHSGEDYVFTGDYSNGQVNITSPGFYHLTDNLITNAQDHAILISAQHVSLDGMSFNLSSGDDACEIGIRVGEEGDNGSITNFSSISQFYDGIYSNATGVIISEVTADHNRGNGIRSLGDNAVIQGNNAFENDRVGITTAGNSALVFNNTVFNNYSIGTIRGGGIITGGRYTPGSSHPGERGKGYYANISGNIVHNNTRYGIYSGLPSARVLNNEVRDEQVGIHIEPVLNCSAHGNQIIGNIIGFRTEYSNDLNLTVTENHLIGNAECGIRIGGHFESGDGAIYNNLLANDVNVAATRLFSNILWTNPVGPTPGQNIVGGPNIAGNYWGSPEGKGWSDLQEPGKSGYSPVPYEVIPGSGVYDSAPLVWPGEIISSSSDEWTIVHPYGNVTYPKYSDARYVTQAKPGAVLDNLKVDGVLKEPNPEAIYTFYELVDDHRIETIGNATPGQVHVRFSCNPVSGSAPLKVQCMDQSVGDPVSWYWQFGDGAVSTEKNPEYTYPIPGTYSVSLRAYNDQTGGYNVCNGCIEVTG